MKNISESRSRTASSVLVVAPTCRQGITGIGLCIESLVNGLGERGFVVELVDTGASPTNSRVGGWAFAKAAFHLRCILTVAFRARHSDVVYVTLSSSYLGAIRDCCVIAIGGLFSRRVIGHLHGGGFRHMFEAAPTFLRWLLERALGSLSKVIVLTGGIREQYEDLVASDDIVVVSNGIAPPLSDDVVSYKLRETVSSPVTLLYLSNLIQTKGYREAIEATRLIRRQRGELVRLLLCGKKIEAGGTANTNVLANDGVGEVSEPGIEFLGSVFGEQKIGVLKDADILVFPTYYPWEGQPLCVIEAMASGIPVVSTKHKGIPEILEDGKEGILLDTADPEDLAKAITSLIDDPVKYRNIALAARARYLRDYSEDVYIEKMQNIIFPLSGTL